MASKPLVLATRRSPLALKQAELVAARIIGKLKREVVLLPMVTTGDRQTDWSLEKTGGKGLFTKELELALLDGRADLAVHSAKDMPTDIPKGLDLVAFLPRENPADILVIKEGVSLPGKIASGSPRRRAQASLMFPRANWVEFRGNVETRLQKIVQSGEAEATLLAAAGLNRLNIHEYEGLTFTHLNFEQMVPAPGQGAIAIQARTEEKPFFIPLNDSDTEQAVLMERSVLNAFGGGCQVALGAHFSKDQGILHFFHEACGIKCLKIDNREQEAWLSELIKWTKKK